MAKALRIDKKEFETRPGGWRGRHQAWPAAGGRAVVLVRALRLKEERVRPPGGRAVCLGLVGGVLEGGVGVTSHQGEGGRCWRRSGVGRLRGVSRSSKGGRRSSADEP